MLTLFVFSCSFSVTILLRKLKQQSRETLEAKRPQLIDALEELGDFYLEIRWDFQSWGRYCLNYIYTI